MSSGITTLNSKVIFNKGFVVNNDYLIVDETGALQSNAKKSVFKNKVIFEDDIEIDGSISSTNGNINMTNSGNLTISGEFYSKNNGTFTNEIRLKDIDNNTILQLSDSSNSYFDNPGKYFGFGTKFPLYFFHVNGNIYGEENLTIANKVIINPDGFSNKYPVDNGTLNVGGNIELSNNSTIKIGGIEFGPSWVAGFVKNKISEIIDEISSGSSFSDISENRVGVSPWIFVNGQIYNKTYDLNGKVGIGTNTPQKTFHVEGDTLIKGNGIYLVGEVYYNDKLLDNIVKGLWNHNEKSTELIYIAEKKNEKIGIGIKDPQYKLDIVGDLHLSENITADSNLYVKNNVGIGTKSPSYKLDVNGDLRVSGKFYINDKEYKEQEPQNVFWMQNSDNNIYYNSNVGINISNPTSDLHVVGDVYVKGNTTVTKNLNCNNIKITDSGTLSYGKDKVIEINSQGNFFIKKILNCNNLTGDIPLTTSIFENQDIYANFIPSNKILQLYDSFDKGYLGIGVSKNGMIFSNNGNFFACLIPYGIDTSQNPTTFNGVVQTYIWDSLNKIWYQIASVSTTLTGTSSKNTYSSSIECNSNGTFLAMSTVNTSVYKVTFYLLSIDLKWSFINYIQITNSENAGKFLIMESELSYLFLSTDENTLSLYINNTSNLLNADFKKSNNFSNDNIGNIEDVQRNTNCSIFVMSSSKGADINYNNGSCCCYAFWSVDGNPIISNSSPFIRIGNIITENNTDSSIKSYFGKKCDISSSASIDTSSGNYKTFKYNIVIAVGTSGLLQVNKSPAIIRIYKFIYNNDNTTSGIVYGTNNIPSYIDGEWKLIGELKHINYKSQIGFGCDFKLNNDGTIIYVGSPNENCVYVFKYNPDENDVEKSWYLLNKIQGFKTGDYGLGYRIAANFEKNNFALTTNDNLDLITHSKDSISLTSPNKIRLYNIDYDNDT